MDDKLRPDTHPLNERTLLDRLSDRRILFVLAVGVVVLLSLTIAGLLIVINLSSSKSSQAPELSPPVSLSGLATQYPELGDILLDPVLGSVYKDFLVAYEEGGMQAAIELARSRGLLNNRDEVIMTLELDTTDTAPIVVELQRMGVRITAVSANFIDIAVPLIIIEASLNSDDPGQLFTELSELEHVIRIHIPIPGETQRGDVETESLPSIQVDKWHQAGFTGQGLKIGVLDLGFDRYKSLLGSDLPANVTVRSFIDGMSADQSGIEHGTACAEIIYDVAPDAELYFAAYRTQTESFQAIDWLVSNGVDIISHSAGTSFGPFDGSSPYARKVDEVSASGIFWVNAAGNSADSHYRGAFRDEDGDGFHEFATNDELLGLVTRGGSTKIFLNWDDYQLGNQDYDLYLYDSDENQIAYSYDIQEGGDYPAEFIVIDLEPDEVYQIVIHRSNATRAVIFDLFIGGNGKELEYYNVEYSISPPSDARGSFTIGAIDWRNDAIEPFSSRGPTGDGRTKPDLVAPDNVSSAAYQRMWQGTSAATPHVAGAAALVWQAFPNYSVSEVKDYLRNWAVDLGERGPDNTFGFGRLNMGDLLESGAIPLVTPTEGSTAVATAVTNTGVPPTRTSTLESTAIVDTPGSPATPSLIPTRTSTAVLVSWNGGTTILFPFAVLICVAVPGMLTLVGIGFLSAVLLSDRNPFSRRIRRTGEQPRVEIRPRTPPGYRVEDIKKPCPRCGTALRENARFCNYCGLDLKSGVAPENALQPCANCGKSIDPHSKFCRYCGQRR